MKFNNRKLLWCWSREWSSVSLCPLPLQPNQHLVSPLHKSINIGVGKRCHNAPHQREREGYRVREREREREGESKSERERERESEGRSFISFMAAERETVETFF